jgi:hypothetical protein
LDVEGKISELNSSHLPRSGHKRRFKIMWTELSEADRVKKLVDIGVPVEVAEKASKGSKTKVVVECTESHKTFAEVDGAFRPVTADGKPVKGAEGKAIVEKYQHLASCYEALGLTKKEALIAATVECRLVEEDIDMTKFEF